MSDLFIMIGTVLVNLKKKKNSPIFSVTTKQQNSTPKTCFHFYGINKEITTLFT